MPRAPYIAPYAYPCIYPLCITTAISEAALPLPPYPTPMLEPYDWDLPHAALCLAPSIRRPYGDGRYIIGFEL